MNITGGSVLWRVEYIPLVGIGLTIDFLIDGQISSYCPEQPEAEGQKHNNATQTNYNVKIKK